MVVVVDDGGGGWSGMSDGDLLEPRFWSARHTIQIHRHQNVQNDSNKDGGHKKTNKQQEKQPLLKPYR